MRSRSGIACLVAAVVVTAWIPTTSMAAEVLDPTTLEKFVDPLPIPGPMPMAGPNYYEIGAWNVQQKLHRDLPPTALFGYGPTQQTAGYPGATIEARKGVPIDIRWTNHLTGPHPLAYAFDATLDHAITTTGIPIVAHVHGAEVEPQSDGGPMTWFTPGFAEKGEDWMHEVYHYANNQLPATIWYHDHAFGFTRHNVYAGLAGYYVIRDPAHEPAGLPSGAFEIPLAIQDRMFTVDGQLWYPNEGESSVHPIWIPEFFGDAILVNGKVWPYLEVEPRKYRFRILNGSNARFYSLALSDRGTSAPGPAFDQIGTDGGYLARPVRLNDPSSPHSPRLLIAPGERADVVVDFAGLAPGTELVLRNTARAPYPKGDAVDPQTTGQVMLFRVVAPTGPDTSVLPAVLANFTRIANPTRTRVMTLNELLDEDDPIGAFLNGMTFMSPATELPELGSTELWEVVNLTGDTHPIHLHLVQFQLLNRQKINVKRYESSFAKLNPTLPTTSYVPIPIEEFLQGRPMSPDPNEVAWKDTYRVNPGEVARFLIRFTPQDASPSFAFDATAEPGYVWHCHILEHEENDMMRPYHLVAPAAPILVVKNPEPSATSPSQWSLVARPAADGAMLRLDAPVRGALTVEVYDVTGRRVASVARGTFDAGTHEVRWDGRDDRGRRMNAGVYFIRMETSGGTRLAGKVVLAH
jgi:FtsP/CotA-like multicopper oxidase with cupredoxin domain